MRQLTTRGTPRIVQVVHRLDVGGLENGVVNLVNRIPADRYRCTIVCLAGYSDEFRRRIHRDDVEVLSLDKKPGKDLPMYGRMWRELRRVRPAVVHTRNLGTVDMQWVAAAAGVPARIHGEHGWEASDPEGLNRKSLRIRRACRPVIHRYVPMSRDLARWLEQQVGVAPSRIRQLYNGVDTRLFTPHGALPADLPWRGMESAARAGTGNSSFVVGTVGRLDPVKDQGTLLRAVRRLIDGRPELAGILRVVLAGEGPMRAQLEGLARELGIDDRTWFAGRRDDTPAVLRTLDAFVLPSINEGISNTILEAMATGLPVFATRVGGNPELVANGVTGALFGRGDVDELASLLAKCLSDPGTRACQGRAGRDRAERNFSIEAMINGYISLYDEVTSRAQAG